jgi:hypothetical protein
VSFDRNGVLQFDSAAFKTRFESNAEDAIKALSNNASSPYIYSGNPSGLAGDIAVAAYGLIKSTGSVTKMAEAFEARKTVVGKKQIDLDAIRKAIFRVKFCTFVFQRYSGTAQALVELRVVAGLSSGC